jgi:hypothetical protein
MSQRHTDSGYGIIKLASVIALPIEEIMFVGDARFTGCNDYSVYTVGMENLRVRGVADTKCNIRALPMFAKSASVSEPIVSGVQSHETR